MKPKFYVTLLLAAFSVAGRSNNSLFSNVSVVGGSDLLSVRSVCQDDNGMIWFGTDMNLYKYDGYDCTMCLDAQDKSNGRLFINCLECFGDSIILGCVDGIAFYDRSNESFTPILYLKDVEVYSLLKDDEGIWIGAQSGLYRYLFNGGGFSSVTDETSFDSEWIRSMVFAGNYIYIGATNHLSRYGLLSGIYEQLQISGLASEINGIDALSPQSNGHILAGTSIGLYDIDVTSRQAALLSRYNWVKCMADIGNQLVIGTDAGLFLYDKLNGNSDIFSGNVVWSIMEDPSGNRWYGSDTGLIMSHKDVVRPIDGLPEGVLNRYCNITGDSMGRIYAGGTHGLVVINPDATCEWYRLGDRRYALSHNKVRSVAHNNVTDRIYALLPTGVSEYNVVTKEFEGRTYDYSTFYDIYGMTADATEMWVATLSGVYLVDRMNTVHHFAGDEGLSSSRAVQVVKNTNGQVLVRTTDRNIFLFDRDNSCFVPFMETKGGDIMKGDLMMDDSNGNIWIARSHDICKMSFKDGLWFSERYDFSVSPSLDIRSMAEVDREIWLCLPGEIVIVNPETGKIGRLSMDTDYAGMYYDKVGGRVLLGATDRIDEVYPDDLRAILQGKTPAIHVINIVVNENTVLPQSIIKTGQVTLSNKDNNIRLSFSDYDYSIGNMRKFMFNLDARDNQWIETKGNSIILPDLPPGRHKLFISASGSEQTVLPIFTIRIKSPWFMSWWALILYASVFLAITFLIVKNSVLSNKLEMERVQKQRLMAQAATKMNFFTEVAHEFKTPLSMIIAPIGKLLQETDDIGQRKTLQLMHNNAMKLNSLIRLSLDYYNDRSAPGEEIVELNVEFVEFARSIFNSFKESWPDHTFIFNSSSPSIDVVTDVIKMETILTNLLSNACKYTPKGGSVIMALEKNPENNSLQIKVSDTGIGIPDDELPFIFQRYFQSSRSKKQSKEGSGIGLTIVKKYVRQMDGDIAVSSDDHGTTFSVTFPLKSDIAESLEEENVTVPVKSDKPLVVIVDDNRSICDFLVDVLSPEFQCICAYDGRSGLNLCKSVSPDIIISDVVMPVMDGLEMCRQIRQNNSLSTVPIILLTARGDHDTEIESIDLNIDIYMSKPFDLDTLLSRVRQLASRRKIIEKKVRIDMIAEPKQNNDQSLDEKFLVKVTEIIENHIDDPDLTVTKLCELGGFSEKQLYRKIKSMTGMSTVEYIRSIRMKKAAMLLQTCKFTVSEAMYMVGFSNTSYFARTFSEMYGKSPSEYQQSFRQ